MYWNWKSAIYNLGAGADTGTYAKSLALAMVSGLSASGILTVDNASDICATLISGFLQISAGVAGQFGIQVNMSNISSDVNNVSNMIKTSSSQTSSTSSTESGAESSFDLGASSGLSVGAATDFGAATSLLSSDLSGIISNLASAFSSSSTFRSIFNADVSSQIARNVASISLQNILTSRMQISFSVSQDICNSLKSGIYNLGAGADTGAYAKAMALAMVSGLSSSGILTADNASDVCANLISGFLQISANVAGQFGIQVNMSNVSSDVSNVSNMIRTSSPIRSTVTSTAYRVQNSFGLGSSSGLNAEIGPNFAAEGSLLSSIVNSLASALSSSSTFRSIFNSGISSQTIIKLARLALQNTLNLKMKVSSNLSRSICSSFQRDIYNLGTEADTLAYAQAMAQSMVSGLSSSGLLTADNASDIGAILISGFLQISADVAGQFGIQINTSSVSSDLNNVSNMFRTSFLQTPSSYTASSSLNSFDLGASAGLRDETGSVFGTKITNFVAPGAEESSTSADLLAIADNLSAALSSSETFRSIFGSGLSLQVALNVATMSLQKVLEASQKISSELSLSICSSLRNSILKLGTGANTNLYAQILAQSVVSGLATTGLLTAENASDIGASFIGGFLKASADAAVQFGIRVNEGILSSDIRNSSNMLRSISSQTSSISTLRSTNAQSSLGVGVSADLVSNKNTAAVSNVSAFDSSPFSGSDFATLVSSPLGLTSSQASSRIQGLTSGLLQCVKQGDIDFNALSQLISSVSSQVSSSGMTASEAKVEALLETLVALLQILVSATPGPINSWNVSQLASQMSSTISIL